MILAVKGSIYIGFSLQIGNRAQIATELTVAVGFIAAALVALWVAAWIVPVSIVAHGIWDYARHQGSKLPSVPIKLVAIPLWYPILRRIRRGGGGVLRGYVEPACLNA